MVSAIGSRYTIQSDDTLSALAETFGTTQEAFVAANPFLNGRTNLIHTGSKLNIPKDATVPTNLTQFVSQRQPSSSSFTAKNSPAAALKDKLGGDKPAPAQKKQDAPPVAVAKADTKAFALSDVQLHLPTDTYSVVGDNNVRLTDKGQFTATFSAGFGSRGGYDFAVVASPDRTTGKTQYSVTARSSVFGFLGSWAPSPSVSAARQDEIVRAALSAAQADPRADADSKATLAQLYSNLPAAVPQQNASPAPTPAVVASR